MHAVQEAGEWQSVIAREGEGLAGAGDELLAGLGFFYKRRKKNGEHTPLVPIMNLEELLAVPG
jgi:hypothetical protein